MPLTEKQLDKVEQIIGHKFKDRSLLRLACNPKLNKNLETGGDGILDVMVYGEQLARVITAGKKYFLWDRCRVNLNFFRAEHLENTYHQKTELARTIRAMLYPEQEDIKHGIVKAGNIVEAIICAALIDIGDCNHHTHEYIARIAKCILEGSQVSDESIAAGINTRRDVNVFFTDTLYGFGVRDPGQELDFSNLSKIEVDEDIKACLAQIGAGLLKYSLARIQAQEREIHEWFEYWRKVLERDRELKIELAAKFLAGNFVSPASIPIKVLTGEEESEFQPRFLDVFLNGGFIYHYQQYERSMIMVQHKLQKYSAIANNSLRQNFTSTLKQKFFDACRQNAQARRSLQTFTPLYSSGIVKTNANTASPGWKQNKFIDLAANDSGGLEPERKVIEQHKARCIIS